VSQVNPIGDHTVAADGPLWSADGMTLWFPQTGDLVRFTVDPSTGVVASGPTIVTLQTTVTNLNGGTTTVADEPSGMALSPDGSKLYVALNGVNQLGVIDTTTNQLVQTIPVGNAPRQVVLNGNTAYVTNEGGRPAKPGDFTNQSDGTPVVADRATGAATSGTVSVVDLARGAESTEIPVGLEPTAEYRASDGTLMVANSNDDSLSFIDPAIGKVVQTVNVNPLPIPNKVGSYPNAITMPDPNTILVSVGRDNALAVYGYKGARSPVKYEGLLPTDAYPVNVQPDPALGKLVVTNDRGIGTRGTQSTLNKGPGTNPATGYNTYDDTSSVTEFAMPGSSQMGTYTSQVFTNNDWGSLLRQSSARDQGHAVPVPQKLGDPSTIKHVFLIVKENRTYDQVLGDLPQGNGDPADTQFGAMVTPNTHSLATSFGLFDNFYDPSTLSADGHNWIVQADANDYVEKEFGAFYRSYPAQGGDALAYQRDGFLWNSVEAAHNSVVDFGEYNNFFNQASPTPSWGQYYQDSQVMEGKASGPMPVPESSIHTYADIPSLNAVDYTEFPPFDTGIPDQYRADVWQQAFGQELQSNSVPNLTMIWLPDDHTGGTGDPNPVAQVADNDLALGRIIDSISHSNVWPSSAVFVMEDDAQNGVDHVDGHRAPLIVASPWAKRGIVDDTYFNQVNVVRTIEQILGAAPMNQEDQAAEPMYDAFTNTPDDTPYNYAPNQVCLTYGAPGGSSTETCPSGSTASSRAARPVVSSPATAGSGNVPSSEKAVYDQWLLWERSGRFDGTHPMQDWANAAQLNRFDWYSAHNWSLPYPGDRTILTPNQVPGANLPAGYLGD
jgi:YVTN family beta-propeller protein